MKFIVAQVYNNYIDANIILGRLQEEEINCWLKDENTVTLTPMWTSAIGGIKLMVPEPQAERAFELLRKYRSEIQALIKCPRCGSANIEFVTTPRKTSNWLGVLIGIFFTSYALSPDKVYHCFDCGHEFETATEKDEVENLTGRE